MRTKWTKETINKVKHLQAEGKTYAEIHQETGVPTGSLTGLLKQKVVTRTRKTFKRVKSNHTVIRTILDSSLPDTMKLLVIDSIV